MTEFTTSKGKFIAVEVPVNLEDYNLTSHGASGWLLYLQAKDTSTTWNVWFDYPVEIIGRSPDILKSEDLAKEIVECLSLGGFGRNGEEWRDYNTNFWKSNPTESFKSLLSFHKYQRRNANC